MKRLALVLAIVYSLTLLVGSVAYADDPAGSGTSIIEQVGCDQTYVNGDQVTIISHGEIGEACQVNDFVNLFIYLMKWGLSILSVLAVLMLVYGGFQFLTAAGRASKVDEGRRIIIGTVVGTIISLTAYVLINTTVTAITGTRLASSNPFGVIGAVFSGDPRDQSVVIQGQTVPINRAFSGKTGSKSGTPTTTPECRKEGSGWDRECGGAYQAHCADPGTATGGTIFNYQQALVNNKGCDCGAADGCYGPQTVACVREFQIANYLPPTGTIDAKTGDLILGGGLNCGANNSAAVVAQLPATSLPTSSMTDKGCCIVSKGTTDLYCLDQVSRRTCDAIGTNDTFMSGYCASVAASRCGYCSNLVTPSSVGTDSKCYQLASKHWCEKIGQNDLPAGGNLQFKSGQCDGVCATCVKSLLIQTKRPVP